MGAVLFYNVEGAELLISKELNKFSQGVYLGLAF